MAPRVGSLRVFAPMRANDYIPSNWPTGKVSFTKNDAVPLLSDHSGGDQGLGTTP